MFPEIVKKMHSDNYGVEGLEVYYDHTPVGTVYFFGTKNPFNLPEHSHAEQFGMVIKGEVTYKINGETKTYKAGESYSIPAGVKHVTYYSANFSEMGYVDDPNYS